MKKFIVEITTEENDDFCESDLQEAIETGIINVGNYELKKIKITKIK